MDRKEYARRLRALIDAARDADREATRVAQASLRRAHGELLQEIAALPAEASTYSRYQLDQLRRATERAMEEFDRQLKASINQELEAYWLSGREIVDRTLYDAVGAPPSLLDLNREQLRIAQDYSADLVTGLSNDARARLNATLRRTALGGQSVTDIIGEIGRTVEGGQFGIISRRAETIYRTEVLRMSSMATQARLEQAVGRGVAAKKMWVHAGVPARVRMYHLQINRQVVPVDEPFVNSGPNSPEDLMFPRDPAGSAQDTVNCGCGVFPWVDEFEKFRGLTSPA